jgi:hypothetical protein
VKLWKAALVLGVTALATAAAADRRHYALKNRYDSNYSATWGALNTANTNITTANTNIAAAFTSITTVQEQINNLFTKIGDPDQNGSGLTDVQSTFLATLGTMGNVGHPSPGDLTSTNTQLDNLLNELSNQGYMLP